MYTIDKIVKIPRGDGRTEIVPCDDTVELLAQELGSMGIGYPLDTKEESAILRRFDKLDAEIGQTEDEQTATQKYLVQVCRAVDEFNHQSTEYIDFGKLNDRLRIILDQMEKGTFKPKVKVRFRKKRMDGLRPIFPSSGSLDIEPDELTRFSFKLRCMYSILEVEFDTSVTGCTSTSSRTAARPTVTPSCGHSGSQTVRNELFTMIKEYGVLGWDVGHYTLNRVVDDLPDWEIRAETADYGAKWEGMGSYPDEFWEFEEALENFAQRMYQEIEPDLKRVTSVHAYIFNGEHSIGSVGMDPEKCFLETHGEYTACKSLPEDIVELRKIIPKYPVVPKSQIPMGTKKKKPGKSCELSVCIDDTGSYSFRWNDRNGPAWADKLYGNLERAAKRIIDSRADKKMIRRRKQEKEPPSLSAESASVIRMIVPESGAGFPFTRDEDVSLVCWYLDDTITVARRSLLVGEKVNEELQRKMVRAREELGKLCEDDVDLETMNGFLSR